MKGIVFTEFLELVEEKFSPEIADQIISASGTETDGAYTSVGTYDHSEILSMVTELSRVTEVPVPDLVKTFGRHLFGSFVRSHGRFFVHVESAFDLLQNVEDYIHVEVRKLYPDAELPKFDTERVDENTMIMRYQSARPFADLAEGLIGATFDHFEEAVEIEREDPPGANGMAAVFTLKRVP